jgi:hypothetical protein
MTTKTAFTIRTEETPTATFSGKEHRFVAAMIHRVAARLELAAHAQQKTWAIAADTWRGTVSIESSADDEAERATVLRAACEAEAGK